MSVVIAYRNMGCTHRANAFGFVELWYRQLLSGWWFDAGGFGHGWDGELIVESGRDDASFTRASALNAAISRAAGRVIIQADPDSVAGPKQLRKAVQMAAEADGLVIPHDRYLYLTEAAADDLMRGRRTSFTPDDCEFSGPDGSGNVVVFSRTTWEQAGGYDERFGLWGGDDAAFRYAVEAFCGPTRRLPGDMLHLHHPRLPQSVPGHPGYDAQFAILAQYRDAAAVGPAEVRRLVAAR